MSPGNSTTHRTLECIGAYSDRTINGDDITILTTIYALVCAFILLPNIILIYGLYKTKTKHKPLTISRKIFLLLVTFQILSGLVMSPYQIYIVRNVKTAGCTHQAVRSFFTGFFHTLCGTTVVLINLERYILISDRKRHRRYFSIYRTRLDVIMLIFTAIAWGVAYGLVQNQTDQKKLATYYTSLAIYTSLLLLTAVVLNFKILNRVVLSRRNSTLSLHNRLTERKLSRTITMMSTSLIICYAPTVCSLSILSYHLFNESSFQDVRRAARTVIWCVIPIHFNYGLTSWIYIMRSNKICSLSSTNLTKSIPASSKAAPPPPRKRSVRKKSEQQVYHDMKKEVSVGSSTCEIKGGQLVLKGVERKQRKISQQQTNFAFDKE